MRGLRQEYEQRYTVEPNYLVLITIYEGVLGWTIEVDDSL